MKCPICHLEMFCFRARLDATILLESEEVCETGCKRFTRHFLTGSYQEQVKLDTGWQSWRWTYHTSYKEVHEIQVQVTEAIHLARKQHSCQVLDSLALLEVEAQQTSLQVAKDAAERLDKEFMEQTT